MSEQALANSIRNALRGHGRLTRVENMTENGTPDANYCLHGCEGWMEYKEISEFPARLDTPVPMKRFTQDQRDWARRQALAGGRYWLVLQVSRPLWYMLFDANAAQEVGTVDRARLATICTVLWVSKLPPAELVSYLTGPAHPFTFRG